MHEYLREAGIIKIMEAPIRLYRHTVLFNARGVPHFICLFFENAPGPKLEIEKIIRAEFAGVGEYYDRGLTDDSGACFFCLDTPRSAPVLEFDRIREDLDPFYAIPVHDDYYLFLNGNRDALEGMRIHNGRVTAIPEYQESYKRNLVRDVYIFRCGYTLEDLQMRIRDRFIKNLKRSLCII